MWNWGFLHGFPYTNFHDLNLDWFLEQFQNFLARFSEIEEEWDTYKKYIDDYFDNLDVQEEIDNKINSMVEDGTFAEALKPTTVEAVDEWLKNNLAPTTPPVDSSLSISGAAADAAVVGRECFRYKGGLTENIANAEVGSYTVNKNNVTGLPTDMGTTYGWLVCFSKGNLYFLYEDTNPVVIWRGNGSDWFRMTDNTLSRTGVPADAAAVGSLCFMYHGSLTGHVTDAEVGSYAVDRNYVSGLPEAMTTRYAWLVCFSKNNLYILYENDNPSVIWQGNGETWQQITDSTLTKQYVPADALAVRNLCFMYMGELTGSIADAEVGSYTVNKNNVTGLPTDMGTTYGWLVCFSKGNLYFLYEDTNPVVIWRGNGTNWFRITDNTLSRTGVPADAAAVGSLCFMYHGSFSGNFLDAKVGSYAVNKNNVTGLPALRSTYAWLTVIVEKSVAFLFEDTSDNPTIWMYKNSWFSVNNQLTGKTITFIGDSLTEYNQTAEYNYARLIARYQHVNAQILGIGGSGFARLRESQRNYYYRIDSINPDCAFICVSGSFNDLSSGLPLGEVTDTELTSICGYMNQFFDKLLNQFPTKRVICYTLNYWGANTDNLQKYLDYSDALKTICRKNAIPFMDVGEKCNIRPWIPGNADEYMNYDDKTHPNDKGQQLMYPIVLNFIKSIIYD